MGKLLPVVIGVVLLVYAIFDLIATPSERIRYLPKYLWFFVLLVPFAGPLTWVFLGHLRPSAPPRGGRPQPKPPFGPRGPDDDPDYLRGL